MQGSYTYLPLGRARYAFVLYARIQCVTVACPHRFDSILFVSLLTTVFRVRILAAHNAAKKLNAIMTIMTNDLMTNDESSRPRYCVAIVKQQRSYFTLM